MPARKSEAQWSGNLTEGSGTIKLGSGAFEGPYSFRSRMEDGAGTNPEELIAAAHAGCYSMALSFALSSAGHVPTKVHTFSTVHFDKVPDGFAITRIDLVTEADVPGLTDEEFQNFAQGAKVGCPVSKALSAVEITLDAQLV